MFENHTWGEAKDDRTRTEGLLEAKEWAKKAEFCHRGRACEVNEMSEGRKGDNAIPFLSSLAKSICSCLEHARRSGAASPVFLPQ